MPDAYSGRRPNPRRRLELRPGRLLRARRADRPRSGHASVPSRNDQPTRFGRLGRVGRPGWFGRLGRFGRLGLSLGRFEGLFVQPFM
jgi:hypothetical protein